MPSLNRTPNEKELEKLVSIYLRAETAIINEIGRLRSPGSGGLPRCGRPGAGAGHPPADGIRLLGIRPKDD